MNQTIQAAQSAPTNAGNGARAGDEAAPVNGKVGGMLAELRSIRDRKEILTEQLSALVRQEQAIQSRLLDYHEAHDVDRVVGGKLSVGFKDAIILQYDPERWPEILKWAVENKFTFLFERRICQSRVEDLLTEGTALPAGLTVTTITKLNIRRSK